MALSDFFNPASTFGSALTATQNAAGAGLALRPANTGRGFGTDVAGRTVDTLSKQLDVFEDLARQMEERRKREEEERKRREEAKRLEAAAQRRLAEQNTSQLTGAFKRSAQQEAETPRGLPSAKLRAFDWGLELADKFGGFGRGDHTMLGPNPVKLGLNSFDDLKEMASDPSKYFLDKDPTFREFFDLRVSDDEDALRNGVINTQYELGRRGYPMDLVNEVIMDWFEKEDVRASFRPTGVSVTGRAPGFDVLAEETNPLVADIARIGVGTGLGFVNPAIGASFFGGTVGISGGATGGREFAGDAVRAVTEGLIFSRAMNLLEDPIVAAAGQAASRGVVRPVIGGVAPSAGRRLGAGLASIGARAGARAGLNVAEDIPATAAELAVRGYSAEEMFPILMQQAAVSGAGGAAVPVLGDTFRGLNRANRATGGLAGELTKPAVSGVTAYTAAKALGASDEQAEVAAVAAVAATSGPLLRRVGGILPDSVLRPIERLGGSVTEMPEIPRNAFDNAVVPPGKVLVYHGTTDAFDGPIRDGINVTPRLGDAEAFQRVSSRLVGQRQSGQVLAMLTDVDNVRRLEDLVGARGGLEVLDGSRVQVLGRVGAAADEVRPFDFTPFTREEPRLTDAQGRPLQAGETPSRAPNKLSAADEGATFDQARRQQLQPFRDLEMSDATRAQLEGAARTHPNAVAARQQRVTAALNEYAFGRSSLTDADWRGLEAQRQSVLAENQRRVAGFQEPLPVPPGDVRMRIREFLEGQYGDIEIPDNIRPEAAADYVLEQISDRARFGDVRSRAQANLTIGEQPAQPPLFAERPGGPPGFGEQQLLTRGPQTGSPPEVSRPPGDAPPAGPSGPPSPPPPDIPSRIEMRNLPDPSGMDAQTRAVTEQLDILSRRATELTSSRRLASKALGPAGKVIDPAVRMDTAPKKIGQAGVVAATNAEQASFTGITDEVAALKPLIGETQRRHMARALAEVAAPLSMLGVAYADDGEIGGLRDEVLIATGFGTMAGLSQAYKAGRFSGMPINSVRMRPEAEALIRAKFGDNAFDVWREVDKIPGGKLSHILENPELYDLTPQQIRAITDFEVLRNRRLAETNAWRRAAGEAEISQSEFNRIFHGIDADSYKRQFPHFRPENPLIEINVPGRLQEQALARQRELGQTWGELHQKYPELRPVRDVAALLAEEARQHSQVRARSTLLYHLKKNGMVEVIPDPESFADAATRDAAAVRMKELGDKGWISVPGIDKHLIDPEAAAVVKDLLAPLDVSGSTFLRGLDSATVAVRTAMFTMDLSAWTLQGAMLAINRPMTFLRHGHDLILSTMSDRYFRYLQKRNDDWFEASASGARLGREFGGLETRAGGSLNPTNIPAIGVIERAGFERFLPAARMFVQRDLARQEAFFEYLSKAGFKAPVIGDAARLVEFAPAAGYATYQLTREEDVDPATMAVMLLLGFGAGAMRDWAGGKFYNRLTEGQQLAAESRAGKMTTRTGGTLQREVMGISPGQARLERTFAFRSPALTRNALTLIGTSFNPGVEGQMARGYLVKTAMTYVAALTAMKYALTGEVDSFNPMDPESILSVENLAKLEIPGMGTLSFSNPLVSAIRYSLYQDRPETEEGYDWGRWNPANPEFYHDKAIGAERFITGRTTDVLGKLINPGIEKITDELVGGETTDVFRREGPEQGRAGDAVKDFAKGLLPLPIQEALDTGLLQQSELGSRAADALGLEPNPAFNSTAERLGVIAGTFSGVNVNPESLGRSIVRQREDMVQSLFGEGANYATLNRGDKARVNAELKKSDEYNQTVAALEEANKDAPLRNVDRYFDAQAKVRDDFVSGLQEAQRLVDSGKRTRSWFRNRRAELMDERRTKLNQLEEQYSEISAQRPGTDESVIEYLNRNVTPEDQAVDGYFDLFDQATTAGDLDFDQLESLREDYLAGLPREVRRYVEDRIADFGEKPGEVPLVDEYNDVKKTLEPFWELRENAFNEFRKVSPFLGQFDNESDFEAYLEREAAKIPGLSANDILDIMSQGMPDVAAYADFVSFAQKAMRLSDPAIDKALVDWYDYTPANRVTYAAGTLGFEVPQALVGSMAQGILSGNISNSVRNTAPFLIQLAARGRRFQDSPTEFVSALNRQAQRE